MFDKNNDKLISKDEWLNFTLFGRTHDSLSYDEFSEFLRTHAKKVCKDPYPKIVDSSSDSDSDQSDFEGFLGPFSEIWFMFDIDKDG